ncbi:MAG: FdhF/YdeP family oxidoreductase [Candidatus Sericytochromatia bacterium]|nr:FdhF/YdeP family oxidoreductase [Candidatus Sericytochromatia bacterium]
MLKRTPWLNPESWASLKPMGLGETKPHHLLETLKVAWDNRDQAAYAWRILNQGVCDGCALGTTGMRDFTLDGLHLCTVRLNLLRLNTMPALDAAHLADVSALHQLSSRELRNLGRLPYPMLRFAGERGFKRVSWDMALGLLARRMQLMDPQRMAFYLTSRGLLNETYYVAQKVARFLGCPHIDNAARICHSPSTTALKASIGEGASTCSYRDWLGSDLILLIGSNVANNQPVTTKYLYHAKQNGARIVVLNPYQEPGLTRYWVPSVPESALFGTALMDHFFQVHTGGDLAFLNGVLKALLEREDAGEQVLDQAFIAQRTTGFGALAQQLRQADWAKLERLSGSHRARMCELADLLAKARSAVFVWSMGITQHSHGVDNVRTIVNLALARGFVGRENCGLMPIRGHSGVQGGGEMGCVPDSLPGGRPLNATTALEVSERWGFEVPSSPGLMAGDMLDAAAAGDLDLLYAIGGNFLETLPDPAGVEAALHKLPLRVHQDIFVSSQMLVEPGDCVLLLPTTTRYEMPGGGSETSTERQVIFSPEIQGPRIGEARTEWQVLVELAQRMHPERADKIAFADSAAIRREIEQICPDYQGIAALSQAGDHFQWGGRLLGVERFRTPDGRAAFACVQPPEQDLRPGEFRLSTRRGKQFNSMVQRDVDPLNGAHRLDILMAAEDLDSLNLRSGAPICLESAYGRFEGFAKAAPLVPGNLQAHWPECNGLLPPDRRAKPSGVPDYNVSVSLHPL